MQRANNFETGLDLQSGNQAGIVQSQMHLSFESQLKLGALYEFIDSSRTTLGELQNGVSGTDDFMSLKASAARLEALCLEADSWGFDALYEVAHGLQRMIQSCNGNADERFRDALHRGLTMLSALLEQCERDFVCRLATADTLECMNQAVAN
jgi:hypothetical protein